MPFLKLNFRPGIVRDTTNYANEGGWYECDKIRFFSGYPQKLGGWIESTSERFIGTSRQLWNWVTSYQDNFLAVGTNKKVYIEVGGLFYDITPLRDTTSAGDVTFSASAGSSVITVTDTAHGAEVGSYVTFIDALTLSGGITATTGSGTSTGTATFTGVSQDSTSGDGYGAEFTISTDGAGNYTVDAITAAGNAYAVSDTLVILGTDLGGSSPANNLTLTITTVTSGNITAAVLNQNYEVLTVPNANTYTISAKNPSTGATVLATADDTGDGGSGVIGAYEITPGFPSVTAGYGWGTGPWNGDYGWGLASPQPVYLPQRDWFFDNFDNDLVMNIRAVTTGTGVATGGPIYYWERGTTVNPGNALATRAVLLSGLTLDSVAPADVPDAATQILVSQNDKHLIAFGCQPYGGSAGDFDPLLIRWATQDQPNVWTPLPTNSAGFLRVSRGSRIVRGLPTRQETVVFTDTHLYSLQFLGTVDVFGLQELADNISIMSSRSCVAVNNVVYWMGLDKFYAYDGRVQTLPCSIREYVFKDINYNQTDQVICGTNEGFNEVWWFYPSANSNWVDRYVIYNHLNQLWYYGNLTRTAWLDVSSRDFPTAVSTDENQNPGILYTHEVGINDADLPMESFIQSSDFDIGEGEQFMLTKRVIPDINFRTSTANNPEVTLGVRSRNFPGSSYANNALNEKPVIETTVDQYTEQVFIRTRGRQMALRISSDGFGVQWQLGAPRLDARPDGKR
jgi:hypothetical protein